MAKSHKEDCLVKWINLLKTGNVQEVLDDVQSKELDEKIALTCIIKISQLVYNDLRKGVELKSSHETILSITEVFCPYLKNRPSTTFVTALYHIGNFFMEKDNLDYMSSIMKIIAQMKKEYSEVYQKEAVNIHDHLVNVLKKAIEKITLSDNVSTMQRSVTQLLSLLFDFLATENSLENGKSFLKTTFYVGYIVGEKDPKAAVRLLSVGLRMFYKASEFGDADSCLPIMFRIYQYLFLFQLKITGYMTALITVDSNLDQVKWKLSVSPLHGECFLLLCNSIKLLMKDCPESSILKKVPENIVVLESLKKSSRDSCVISVCALITSMAVNSHKMSTDPPAFPGHSMKQFLRMLLNICGILEGCEISKSDLLQGLADVLIFLSDIDKQYGTEVLNGCVETVVEAEVRIFKLLEEMRLTQHKDAKVFTNLVLARCTSVIRTYHLGGSKEDTILVTKPLCKFICSLPSDVFEDQQNQQVAQICFSVLADALSDTSLDKALEVTVVWLAKCPMNAKKVLKMWGDLKHNTVCLKNYDGLDTSLWTIIIERKNTIEREWMPLYISDNTLADFLIQELEAYFVCKSLRGTPVLAAADALFKMNTDCLTQAKGLVIAMDIASVSNTFYDKCVTYYNKSKAVVAKLRKQKKYFDPVELNCCMGNLLYIQLRCELRFLRKSCETEMVRLSALPQSNPAVDELPESRPDPGDVCDVITKYSNLCLSKHRKLLEDMDSALRHWQFAYTMLKEETSKEYDSVVTLSNVHDAGFLLKLYCDDSKQGKVWQLLFNMASLAGNVCMIVSSVGELLNTGEELDPNMIEKAQNLLNDPGLTPKVKISFHLNIAFHMLKNEKIEEGLILLNSLQNNLKTIPVRYTQFLITVGGYQQLGDWNKYSHLLEASPSYAFSYHKALSHLLYLDEDTKHSSFAEVCQVHWQLLTVSRLLGEAFWAMEHPRSARCYLRSPLSLAQKLALPLRTAQLLVLLAWVDLSTGMFDDCAVKLESIEDLLELCGSPLIYGKDVSPNHKLNRSIVSPPEYLDHTPSCKCLPCTTPEYRRLVLETVTMRATLSASIGRPKDALHCFDVGIRIQEDLAQSPERMILQSRARLWLRYGDVLASSDRLEEALSANKNAQKLLNPQRDLMTLQDALEQELMITSCLNKWQHKPICPKINLEVKKTPTKTHIPQMIMTPKNTSVPGKSPLTVISKNVNIPITPYTRPVPPPFILHMSDEENSPVETSKTARKTKLPLSNLAKGTPQSCYNFLKPSRTPFTIVDDDGNPVNVPSSKKNSTVKEKPPRRAEKSELSKKLFYTGSCGTKSEPSIPVEDISSEVMIKSKRTYKNNKIHGNATQTKSDAFTFCEMKKVIGSVSDVEGAQQNVKTTKMSSKLVLPSCSKRNNVSELPLVKAKSSNVRAAKKVENLSDSDCDFVEGTPPHLPAKKTTLSSRLKRATRSNNV